MIVKPISWQEAIDAAEHELQLRAIKDARLNAELLAAHVMGLWTRREVRQRSKEVLSQQDLDFYQALIRRRTQHEPLQYITGETEFFGLRLYSSPAALIPRPDTEMLVEETLRAAGDTDGNIRMLDIGTGSGCIALAIASKLPDATVIGIDVSAEALDLAEKNRRRCGLANVVFNQIDLNNEAELRTLGQFDLVISNPPYIPLAEYVTLEPEVLNFEPRNALTDEGSGLSFYKKIIGLAELLLKPDGRLLLEMGYGAKDAIIDLAGNLHVDSVTKDLSGIDRVIVFRK